MPRRFRILHTADWHLGQQFQHFSRQEEQQLALDWLLATLRAEAVDLLLVAGDIFDVTNPPNYAREQYYRFLAQLRGTPCRHVVITGGNHDSPSLLNAPADLLRHLHIHVLGAASADPRNEFLLLRDAAGQVEATVAAVPFLREGQLRQSLPGLQYEARVDMIREGIRQHYAALGKLAAPHAGQVPCIAMGHLYASGASADEAQRNIYLSDTQNISVADFPDSFHYVALGHIHRPQPIGGQRRVRYSGSLVPLSFAELGYDKTVTLVDFEGAQLGEIRQIKVPAFRQLLQWRGTLADLTGQLRRLAAPEHGQAHWLDLEVMGQVPNSQAVEDLREAARKAGAHIVRLRSPQRQDGGKDSWSADKGKRIEQFSPLEVFDRLCAREGRSGDAALRQQFLELLEAVQQDEAS